MEDLSCGGLSRLITENFNKKFSKKIRFYDGFVPTFMILGEFWKKKFFFETEKKIFFNIPPHMTKKIYKEKFRKNFFSKFSFKIINVGTKPT